MSYRVWFVIGLFVVIPITTWVLIEHEVIDPQWLSVPDALICLSLLFALHRDRWMALFGAGFVGLSAYILHTHSSAAPLLPALMYLIVARIFGQTLAEGHVPLITQTAKRVHGKQGISAALSRYTRRLTRVWMWLFIGVALIQSHLYFFKDSSQAWIFGTSIVPFILTGFFVIEPWCRRYLIPGVDSTPLRTILNHLATDGWK